MINTNYTLDYNPTITIDSKIGIPWNTDNPNSLKDIVKSVGNILESSINKEEHLLTTVSSQVGVRFIEEPIPYSERVISLSIASKQLAGVADGITFLRYNIPSTRINMVYTSYNEKIDNKKVQELVLLLSIIAKQQDKEAGLLWVNSINYSLYYLTDELGNQVEVDLGHFPWTDKALSRIVNEDLKAITLKYPSKRVEQL